MRVSYTTFRLAGVKHATNNRSRIETVKRRVDLGSELEKENTLRSRTGVVSDIKAGYTYVTAYKNNDNKWTKGEDVRVISLGGIDFIRTDRNETKADNLGEISEF